RLVEALRAEGIGVWWDQDIAPNAAWEATIERELSAAKLVIVAWSPAAVASKNVKAEARWARGQGRLLQLFVEACQPPLFFGERQGVDIKHWSGAASDAAFRTVLEAVRKGLASAPVPASETPVSQIAPRGPPVEPLLAVLAFDNLSGDPEMAYFSDGVSEEIQQTVAHGADLKVIGRNSSFQFRGADKASSHVASKLGATHVLDGSVRRSGPRVRISAQLVECAGQSTLWSDRFDRDLTDIFALQDEIAAAVAAALKVVFAPTAKATPIDPAAYDLYLRARATRAGPGERWAVRSAAVELLDRAVALAPGFARAWALLAYYRAQLLRNAESDQPYAVQRSKVVEAAETALRLDPGQGLAYQALADLQPFASYAEREALHREALAAAPNDTDVLVEARLLLSGMGRAAEALVYAKRAYDLDPMNFEAAFAYAAGLGNVGRYADGAQIFDWMLTQWPESGTALAVAASFAASQGDWARFDDMVRRAHDAGALLAEWGIEERQVLRAPDSQLAQDFLQRFRDDFAQTKTVVFRTLSTLCGLGLRDDAFAMIEEAPFAFMSDPAQRWALVSNPAVIFSVALNAPMMRDPRFPRLCAKLGLCDYWVKSGQWPDCAEEGVLPYDFKAECRKLAGAAA
ncbi:MAG: TIR domain-containing protein, partial [Caulobacterales bacterium]